MNPQNRQRTRLFVIASEQSKCGDLVLKVLGLLRRLRLLAMTVNPDPKIRRATKSAKATKENEVSLIASTCTCAATMRFSEFFLKRSKLQHFVLFVTRVVRISLGLGLTPVHSEPVEG